MSSQVDKRVLASMRENFSPVNGVECLLAGCQKVAEAIGVTFEWSITLHNSNAQMQPEKLAQGIREITSSIGCLSAGAKLNPLKVMEANSHGSNEQS